MMQKQRLVWSLGLSLALFLSAAGGLHITGEPEAVAHQAVTRPSEPTPPMEQEDPAPVPLPVCERSALRDALEQVTQNAEVPTGLPVDDLVAAVPPPEVCEVVALVLDILFCDKDEECKSLLVWLRELVERVLEEVPVLLDAAVARLPDGVPASTSGLTETVAAIADEAVPAEPVPEGPVPVVVLEDGIEREEGSVQDQLYKVQESVEELTEPVDGVGHTPVASDLEAPTALPPI